MSGGGQRSLRQLSVAGALSDITNPKIAVFHFTFLPQFVLPSAAHAALTIFVLGLLFAPLTFGVKGPVGLFAGLRSEWLRQRPQALRWIYRSSGVVLLDLGIKLAFGRRP